MKIKTWKELRADPRVAEVWSEDDDGVEYWVVLNAPWKTADGLSTIHEWSQSACIRELNLAVSSAT
jgi:hypothetical protein